MWKSLFKKNSKKDKNKVEYKTANELAAFANEGLIHFVDEKSAEEKTIEAKYIQGISIAQEIEKHVDEKFARVDAKISQTYAKSQSKFVNLKIDRKNVDQHYDDIVKSLNSMYKEADELSLKSHEKLSLDIHRHKTSRKNK